MKLEKSHIEGNAIKMQENMLKIPFKKEHYFHPCKIGACLKRVWDFKAKNFSDWAQSWILGR